MTCRAIYIEEIIDLTAAETPNGFRMLVDIPSDNKDINIAIIKNGHIGHKTCPVNHKYVGNAEGGESRNEYKGKDSEVLDEESMLVDYISR